MSESYNDQSDLSEANPIIKRIIEESLANQPKSPLRSEFENIRPSDMEQRLAFTAFKESSNRPEQVNASNPKKPTTGYFHIEQPTYVENLREKYGDAAAKQVSKLSPKAYLEYIQKNKDEEREIAEREISKKVDRWGDRPVKDHLGNINPAWRVAYTMGDTGFSRYLRNTKQDK